jgi:hypothetical protein
MYLTLRLCGRFRVPASLTQVTERTVRRGGTGKRDRNTCSMELVRSLANKEFAETRPSDLFLVRTSRSKDRMSAYFEVRHVIVAAYAGIRKLKLLKRPTQGATRTPSPHPRYARSGEPPGWSCRCFVKLAAAITTYALGMLGLLRDEPESRKRIRRFLLRSVRFHQVRHQ